jgi:hypothetical protein
VPTSLSAWTGRSAEDMQPRRADLAFEVTPETMLRYYTSTEQKQADECLRQPADKALAEEEALRGVTTEMDIGGTGVVKEIQVGSIMPKKSVTIQRGTIYRSAGGSPYERTEARDIIIQPGQQAQFAAAVIIIFTRKGTRKRLEMTICGGKLVILEGWGHPQPPGIWDKGASVNLITERRTGITVTANASRNCLGDSSWDAEFNVFLDHYLAAHSGVKIVADYREHDFKDKTGPHFYPQELTPEMPVIVLGVENGEVVPRKKWTTDSRWGKIIPRQEFSSLAEAQRVFPNIDLLSSRDERLTGPTVDEKDGKPCSRFETHEVWNMLSLD